MEEARSDVDPERGRSKRAEKSFGNIGPAHWSRARKEHNREALDYYRERSRAPGVAEGGGARNHYCMECDGVIPFDHAEPGCPHCGAELAGTERRFFNWVEIDKPPTGDARALLRPALWVVLTLSVAGAMAYFLLA